MRQPSARLDDSCAWRRWPKTSMAASRGCANLLALVEIRTGRAQGTSTRERSAVRSPERLRARVAHAQAVSRYPKSGRNSMPHSENPDLSLRCARQRAALGFRAPQAEKNCPKGPKTRFPYQKRDNFLASSRRRRRKIVRKRSLRRRLSSDVQLRAWRPAAAR